MNSTTENKAAVANEAIANDPRLQHALSFSGAAILTILEIDPNNPNEDRYAKATMGIVQRIFVLGYSLALEHLEAGKLGMHLAEVPGFGEMFEQSAPVTVNSPVDAPTTQDRAAGSCLTPDTEIPEEGLKVTVVDDSPGQSGFWPNAAPLEKGKVYTARQAYYLDSVTLDEYPLCAGEKLEWRKVRFAKASPVEVQS